MWENADEWDVLFVGGAPECRRRLDLVASWNVDSVDGTYLAFGPGSQTGAASPAG